VPLCPAAAAAADTSGKAGIRPATLASRCYENRSRPGYRTLGSAPRRNANGRRAGTHNPPPGLPAARHSPAIASMR
jgi:hypothetical protein